MYSDNTFPPASYNTEHFVQIGSSQYLLRCVDSKNVNNTWVLKLRNDVRAANKNESSPVTNLLKYILYYTLLSCFQRSVKKNVELITPSGNNCTCSFDIISFWARELNSKTVSWFRNTIMYGRNYTLHHFHLTVWGWKPEERKSPCYSQFVASLAAITPVPVS